MVSEHFEKLHVTLDTNSGRGEYVCLGCDASGDFVAKDRESALGLARVHLTECPTFAGVGIVPGTIEIDGGVRADVSFNTDTGKVTVMWPEGHAPDDVRS